MLIAIMIDQVWFPRSFVVGILKVRIADHYWSGIIVTLYRDGLDSNWKNRPSLVIFIGVQNEVITLRNVND
jgi:hypothetical protein